MHDFFPTTTSVVIEEQVDPVDGALQQPDTDSLPVAEVLAGLDLGFVLEHDEAHKL